MTYEESGNPNPQAHFLDNVSCPYLGLKDDPQTCMAYAAAANFCHRLQPPKPVSLVHQHQVCLTSQYASCKILQGGQDRFALTNLHSYFVDEISRKNKKTRWVSIILFFVIFLFLGIFSLINKKPFGTAQNIPLTSDILTSMPFSSPTAMPASVVTASFGGGLTATPVVFASPLPVNSPTPTMIHTLDMPIGDKYKFVIHKVRVGESLEYYARQYNTTTDAILRVNYRLQIPLWVDTIIIIPLDMSDASGLPAFEAHLVVGEEVTLKQIALQFGVSVDELVYYNAFAPEQVLPAGTWVLIPRMQTP